MTITQPNCPACDAPISVPGNLDETHCTVCGSFLLILRRGDAVTLKAAEKPDSEMERSDPYSDQIQSEETADLKAWGKGCLMGMLLPIAFLVIGFMLGFFLFNGDDGLPNSNRILGVACLMTAPGIALGANLFLRKVAPGVYLRGISGLPDFPITPRSSRLGLRSVRVLKGFGGIITCVLIYFLMLALVSFTMDVNEERGNLLIGMGILLGPAAGLWVMTRTAIYEPLEPMYE